MFQGRPKFPLSYEQTAEDKVADLLVKRLGEQGEIPLKEKTKQMSTCQNIEGIEVYFPYKPYDVQLEYMKNVILTLKNPKQNALLQSPTGTGKTLSLLCSTLAWLRQQRQEAYKLNLDPKNENAQPFIKIIYASRTHSQLKQVAKELKRTVYEPKLCILGSRDQLCIKSEFRALKGNQLNQSCQKAISNLSKNASIHASPNSTESTCSFFAKDHLMWLAGTNNREVMDIEELKQFGRKNKCCPYFFERMRKDAADIILLPYNYLLEHQFTNIVEVENSILIFDEAHNVPSTAEEGSSFFLSSTMLDDAEKELNRWIEIIMADGQLLHRIRKQENDENLNISLMRGIEQTMKCFGQFMAELANDKRFYKMNENADNPNVQGFVLDAPYIIDWLYKYTKDQSGLYQTTLTQEKPNPQNFSEGLSEANIDTYVQQGYKLTRAIQDIIPGYHFENWLRFVKLVSELRRTQKSNSDSWIDKTINHYKLCVTKDERDVVTINLWCLDPGQAFQRLKDKGAYSIILTSGTLTPFSSWPSELRMEFHYQLNNGHVIDIQNSLVAGIVAKGPNGNEFNFGYNNRQNPEIYDELGLFLLNMVNHIRHGVLVVFCSYGLMNKCKWEWTKNTKQILLRMQQVKSLYWEPNAASELQDQFNQFAKSAQTDKGAIMFGVCRGKIAEGIDFSDDLCRAVFVIGIPFPPLLDQKVKLKRGHIDRIFHDPSIKNFQKINSSVWYSQQAIRATNQAIGRVIRHKEDFGGIYLCDARFEGKGLKNDISSWVLPVLQSWSTFGDTLKMSCEFFNKKNSSAMTLKLQPQSEPNQEEEENLKKKRNKGIVYYGLGNKSAELQQNINQMLQRQRKE